MRRAQLQSSCSKVHRKHTPKARRRLECMRLSEASVFGEIGFMQKKKKKSQRPDRSGPGQINTQCCRSLRRPRFLRSASPSEKNGWKKGVTSILEASFSRASGQFNTTRARIGRCGQLDHSTTTTPLSFFRSRRLRRVHFSSLSADRRKTTGTGTGGGGLI